MVHKETYNMKFRRRKEGRTDYKKRLALLKSRKPRLVVRVSGRTAVVQVINYDPKGDKVLIAANSTELRKAGWKGHGGNKSSAYLTGLLAGKKAIKAGVKECVLDIGLHTPVRGSNVFAALKGALDAGMDIQHSDTAFPKEELMITDEVKAAAEKIKV